MEAGIVDGEAYDLIDAMVMAADDGVRRRQAFDRGTTRLPDLRFLFGNVHGQLHELSQ